MHGDNKQLTGPTRHWGDARAALWCGGRPKLAGRIGQDEDALAIRFECRRIDTIRRASGADHMAETVFRAARGRRSTNGTFACQDSAAAMRLIRCCSSVEIVWLQSNGPREAAATRVQSFNTLRRSEALAGASSAANMTPMA